MFGFKQRVEKAAVNYQYEWKKPLTDDNFHFVDTETFPCSI